MIDTFFSIEVIGKNSEMANKLEALNVIQQITDYLDIDENTFLEEVDEVIVDLTDEELVLELEKEKTNLRNIKIKLINQEEIKDTDQK